MRKVTDAEVLALTKMLESETYSLALARASLVAISDEQLKSLAQSGINATEARISGLQQFITENKITVSQGITQ
jgi:uncharacterized protein (DUF305 family)